MNKNIFIALFAMLSLATHAQSLKVMTYNIRLDAESDGVNQWPKRTNKVYDLIRKYDPDILGVQEALHHQLQDLLTNLPEYTFVGVGRDDGKTKGEYSAILLKKKRFSVEKQNTFWLSETPDIPGSKSWDAAITRVATWAVIHDAATKKTFMIVNTHFDHIGEVARGKSAALIKEKIAALRNGLPVIVTGDFNSEPSQAAYRTMVDGTVLKIHTARPASETQGTFCTFFVASEPCRVIDYIFYSDGWSPKNYHVITDNDGSYYPSDHLPVICEFSWSK
ncbi:MAG TPA: endonuclease/exonuclease/phosphatase family protein [Ohtaekwangia sp.]|uniref:endonuclease/exonuclease/phosphatase family protein n=1 Tax=Ohtaekwangia sp. TaxID=2066019 RepID=UPI002F95EAAD